MKLFESTVERNKVLVGAIISLYMLGFAIPSMISAKSTLLVVLGFSLLAYEVWQISSFVMKVVRRNSNDNN